MYASCNFTVIKYKTKNQKGETYVQIKRNIRLNGARGL